MYYRFLALLLSTKCRNIILVGGNHDSGNLLDAPRELLDAINIHVVGTIANKNIEEMVFKLLDENEECCGVCAAVPYVPEILLRDYSDKEICIDGSFSDIVYTKLYNAYLEVVLLRILNL